MSTPDIIQQPYKHNLYYFFILLLGAILVFWPISFHVFSVKNDAINYFLPVRWQISEAISSGHFPFWSPYFNLGYALHGDMQSGVWNPFVWLFSIGGPYTLYTLHLETVLYVFLSGIGMFLLLKHLDISPSINLLCAFAYMLCGFNTDSAQFLNWISSASFIPFVVLFYYKTLHEGKIVHALYSGLFFYLLFVAAYPAHVIMMIYLLLIMAFWFLVKNFSTARNKQGIIFFIRNHAIFAITFIILSLPAIISYLTYLPLSERGEGATYYEAMSNPLDIRFLISYLFPLPVFNAPFGELNDPLGRNSYFGMITFCFFLSSFFIKKTSPWFSFCKWGFIITLVFSLGRWYGIRALAYDFLPLMDSFRHPSGARIYTIFFGCLLSAYTFQSIATGNATMKSLRISFRVIVIATMLISILCIIKLISNPSTFASASSQVFTSASALKTFLYGLSFFELLTINIIIQLPFIYLLYRKAIFSAQWRRLIIIGIVNIMLIGTLLMPFTVVKKDRAANIQDVLNTVQVKGYPIPDLNKSLEENSQSGISLFNEIGTSNMYNKRVGRVDYRISPSNLLSQNEFWFNTYVRNMVMKYPLIYKADSALTVSDSAFARNLDSPKKYVLVERTTIRDSINQAPAGDADIKIEKFDPGYFSFNITSNSDGYYSLLQNHFPFWDIRIDKKKIKPDKTNIAFMGFYLTAGNHTVAFEYNANVILITALISIICLMSIIAYAIFRKNK